MKSIFSLYTFLSLFVTFSVIALSNANTEMGISQNPNDEAQDELEYIISAFKNFFLEEVLHNPSVACKRELSNRVMQTEIGLELDRAYFTFTGNFLSDIINLVLDDRIKGIQSFGESLANVSSESLEQLQGYLIATFVDVQDIQESVSNLRIELERIRIEWSVCIL